MQVLRLRTDDVASQRLEEVTVLLDLRSSLYLRLNESAGALLELVRDGTSLDELTQSLVARYGLPPDVARADVGAFVGALREHGLLLDAEAVP